MDGNQQQALMEYLIDVVLSYCSMDMTYIMCAVGLRWVGFSRGSHDLMWSNMMDGQFSALVIVLYIPISESVSSNSLSPSVLGIFPPLSLLFILTNYSQFLPHNIKAPVAI